MLKNYFRVALRILFRHKGYSIINIAGLSVGISCFLLALLLVMDELSYDRFHEHAESIYRVRVDAWVGDREYHTARSSAPVTPALLAAVPGVEAVARIRVVGDRAIRYEDRAFNETRFYFVDSTIFKVFTFQPVEGDMKSFLTRPGDVVVTEETAHKYFGNSTALGKTFIVDGNFPITVCGVVKAFPSESHWHFDFLCAKSTRDFGDEQDWFGNNWHTYVRLKEGVSAAQAEEALSGVTVKYVIPRLQEVFGISARGVPGGTLPYRFVFQPLTDIHLFSHLDEEFESNGMFTTVLMFGIVGVLVLMIACINIMNLNAARSAQRAKEVGIRKVLGSGRGQLIQLFLSETFILSLVALLVSLATIELILPTFNSMTGRLLSLEMVGVPLLISGLVLLMILVAALAGTIPAVVLSAFTPVKVLKGQMTKGTQGTMLRSILVVTQFAVSIALMLGTVVVFRQVQFMRTRDLGYDKSNLLVVDNTWRLSDRCEAFRQALLQRPGIVDAAFTQNLPGKDISSGLFRAEGQERSQLMMLRQLFAGRNYLSMLGVKLREGRFISNDISTDSSDVVLVNASAARMLGYEHPIGRKVIGYFGPQERPFTIVGVTEDFHYEPLYQPILPMVVMVSRGEPTRIVLRVQGNLHDVVEDVGKQWAAFSGNQPLTWYFLDERIDRYYRRDEAVGTLFGILSSLGIFLSCLGLLGLTMHATERRRKEMGIRKVLGASVSGLGILLVREFVKLVAIAVVIAWPVAYLFMHGWLDTFAYRIDQRPVDFALAGLVALSIALSTVAYHVRKVAVANPVESLRYE
ncbi:MAG TPA: ABC transporter permease [Bacteroidota bacterium]|nr:ABC transporter permease [Bacteroidota bacterium]